jgi:type IV/VI secretion system ImpK/VasF family protein
MSVPASKLWFCIEACFSQILARCEEARAADTAQEMLDGISEAAVHGWTLRQVGLQLPSANDTAPASAGLLAVAQAVDVRKKNPAGADIPLLRKQVRSALESLKRELDASLALRDAFYVLYPLVIYADELMANVTNDRSRDWESLHAEWFESDDGGELFYDRLEPLLTRAETHPLVYQVYYFCLQSGFVGRVEDAGQRAKLMERVAEKIPIAAAAQISSVPPPTPIHPSSGLKALPVATVRYLIYGATVLFLGVLFLQVRQ